MAIPLYLAGWLIIPEEGADSTLAHELLEKVRNFRPSNGQIPGCSFRRGDLRAGDAIDDATGNDAAKEMDGVMKPSSKPARTGLTERLAAASARRPKRTLLLWGMAVVVALVLVGTTLQGLTTSEAVSRPPHGSSPEQP
jgi:hypothetical protein